MMKSISTRFRAYQLGSPGSSFSYFAGGHFTVIEGRLTERSRPNLVREMQFCGVKFANTLHITSWDADHCSSTELDELLELVSPNRIECPGYDPHCDNAHDCLAIIKAYKTSHRRSNQAVEISYATPDYINSLDSAGRLAFRDVVYHPRWIDDACNNNNSTVKFFRRGSFNVLSLGDVECNNLSSQLRRAIHLRRETDVMILAHHGADNGFTNKKLLQRLEPSLTICSSDYDSQYEHPAPTIRGLLQKENIELMTTKRGDVIVESIDGHAGKFRAINLEANSTKTFSQKEFWSKKATLLSYNDDTIRELYR